jgi:hypothetical protein
MAGNNYPPGMSHRDFIRAGIIQPHRHEHEWGTATRDSPIIEDGAAIFNQQCEYVEGQYGQGYQCEETRSVRFEYGDIESPDDEYWQVPEITEWTGDGPDLPDDIAAKVVTVEQEGKIIGVDPHPELGEVSLSHEGWTLTFRP